MCLRWDGIVATVKEVLSVSDHVVANMDTIDFEAISLFVSHSLYMAATVLGSISEASSALFVAQALESLRESLEFFNRRWMVAGMFI